MQFKDRHLFLILLSNSKSGTLALRQESKPCANVGNFRTEAAGSGLKIRSLTLRSKAVNQLIIPIYIPYFMIFLNAPPERIIAELSAILSCKESICAWPRSNKE